MKKSSKVSAITSISGLVFVACMFTGMGLGFFFGEKQTGLFLGMGIGFAAMAVLNLVARERDQEN